MGGSASLWLMLAELGLALAFGRTPSQHFSAMRSFAGMPGLAGQLGFATLPLLVRPHRA